MGDNQILPFRYFLVFFLKTWFNQGVSFQLNTFWKEFQSQKQSSEQLYNHLTQCYSPPYFRTLMCSYCLTLRVSHSTLSHACKFASTIWVKNCFHSAHTLLCPCSTSAENPYLLFYLCLLPQYHQHCSFSQGCCQSPALQILETAPQPSPPLSNKELSEAVAVLSGV